MTVQISYTAQGYIELKNKIMTNGNSKKAEQLGMPYGTACGRLRKLILFKLLRENGKDICYRCGKRIDTPEELSIEHKIDWLDSEDPVGIFFDLDNIAFSHLSCNSRAASRDKEFLKEHQRDLCRKGKHSISHLNQDDVIEIKKLLKEGVKSSEIKRKFNISKYSLHRIKTSKAFSYIE